MMRTPFAAVLLASSLVAATAGADVTVTVTTTPNGGPYAPKNIVAIWVENQAGTFVKTIDRFAGTRKSHLVAWIAKAGNNDVDAVSGATRQDHAQPLTMTWNLRDKLGALVPDGTYTVRMELADSNASQPAQNHQGTFTFVKGPTAQQQTALTNGGFLNVSIDFQPVADNCNNGVVDSGETCDPALAGSCVTTCTPSADACLPNNLVGTAATCTAACTVQPITECVNGDGCCAAGCDAASDDDCVPGAGSGSGGGGGTGDDGVSGGCETGGGAGLAFGALGLGLLLVRRRR
jgi:MYXO-CTERM domain-containing protein